MQIGLVNSLDIAKNYGGLEGNLVPKKSPKALHIPDIDEIAQKTRDITHVITSGYILENGLPKGAGMDVIGRNFDKYA